ncbi:hypothetical protein MKEN_01238500 [Mycena kentingensis (nom. inval.)]|nr:hypothetical protein MKEN_01238500 [Mycena kentingensis (nom. inval.)]
MPTPLRPILKALHLSPSEPTIPKRISLDSGPGPFPFARMLSGGAGGMYSPHVHFPTHPCTMTGAAYSPGSYDRAPILVSPNSRKGALALPERGGRVYGCTPLYTPSPVGSPQAGYAPQPQLEKEKETKGSYFHPRAYEACDAPEAVPELDDDGEGVFSSSESSECPSPDPGADFPGVRIAGANSAHALSFLPHPHPHSHPPTPGFGLGMGMALLHPVKRERRKKARPRHARARSSFADEENSCLGGF